MSGNRNIYHVGQSSWNNEYEVGCTRIEYSLYEKK